LLNSGNEGRAPEGHVRAVQLDTSVKQRNEYQAFFFSHFASNYAALANLLSTGHTKR
jgi:hypothetical protein